MQDILVRILIRTSIACISSHRYAHITGNVDMYMYMSESAREYEYEYEQEASVHAFN